MHFSEWDILIGAAMLGTSVAMVVQLIYTSASFYPVQGASIPFMPALIGSTKLWITFSHVYISFSFLNIAVIRGNLLSDLSLSD